MEMTASGHPHFLQTLAQAELRTAGPVQTEERALALFAPDGRYEAESTYDATHLFMVEAKQARAAALPAPTLATVFEVVIGGAYIASPDRRCSAGSSGAETD